MDSAANPLNPQPAGRAGVNLRLLVVGAILMLAAPLFLWVDLAVAHFAREGHFPGELRTIVRLAEAFSHGYGALAILLAVWVVTRVNWKQMAPLFAVVYIPGAIVSLFKVSIARRRPNAFVDELPATASSTFESVFPWATESWAGVDRAIQSFPSGHTATGVGLAIALSLAFPKGRIYFGAVATLAALQRIDAGAHFPSDTVFAAGLTFAVSAVLMKWWPIKPWVLHTQTQLTKPRKDSANSSRATSKSNSNKTAIESRTHAA